MSKGLEDAGGDESRHEGEVGGMTTGELSQLMMREAAAPVALEVMGSRCYALPKLERAWEKVRKNKGAGGIDRQTIASFERNKEQELRELHRLLREKRYRPQALRRVYIPRAHGERRP